MTDGWIKLHRQIEEWEWYTDVNTMHLFVHLLIRANRQPKQWRGVNIDTGQLVTSFPKLAEQTGLSVRNVRTCLIHLESTKEVTCKSTNKFTIITIANYQKYQVIENSRHADRHATDMPTDRQPTINKKEKNQENQKNTTTIGEKFENEIKRWAKSQGITNTDAWLLKLWKESGENLPALKKAWNHINKFSTNPTTSEFWSLVIDSK